MLNVFSKTAVMTTILRYTANLWYKVHENIEDNNMIADVSNPARQQRIRFAQQATAVVIYLAPRFWRGGFYLSKTSIGWRLKFKF